MLLFCSFGHRSAASATVLWFRPLRHRSVLLRRCSVPLPSFLPILYLCNYPQKTIARIAAVKRPQMAGRQPRRRANKSMQGNRQAEETQHVGSQAKHRRQKAIKTQKSFMKEYQVEPSSASAAKEQPKLKEATQYEPLPSSRRKGCRRIYAKAVARLRRCLPRGLPP